MDSYLGEIMFFAGKYIPEGWVACNGQALKISECPALYSLIGTAFGGDGTSTFCVPNLDARLPVGYGASPSTGGTIGMAQSFGVGQNTLTVANLPAHFHTLNADKSNQTGIAAPTGAILTTAVETGTGAASCYIATPASGTVTMAQQSVGYSAGSAAPLAYDNVMPTMPLTPIMCTMGLYPSRG